MWQPYDINSNTAVHNLPRDLNCRATNTIRLSETILSCFEFNHLRHEPKKRGFTIRSIPQRQRVLNAFSQLWCFIRNKMVGSKIYWKQMIDYRGINNFNHLALGFVAKMTTD